MNTSIHDRVRYLLFLFALLWTQVCLAAVPANINYQGYLTDTGGLPLNATLNITFNVYDASTGGTLKWTETKSVVVSNGLFNVQLGGGSFPSGLFDTPLWLGIAVDTDAEMTPRTALDSSAYALKADDANTVGGIDAATLDQSAHVIDTANPHSVTAAQVGAADAGVLLSHTSNTANPHNVTAAQTGATDTASFVLHSSNASAHHVRYNNTEAVAAMGATADSNPLNHTKRSDAQILSAVTALDGSGSSLDADLVDGLQASEIIDAAQDEVRTPISSLPFTINTPGSYYLTGNLDGSNGGIRITVDNVTLDLMGFSIDGIGSVIAHGIYISGRSHIVIKNGFITNFTSAGVYQNLGGSRHITVIDVQVEGNGTVGTSGSVYSGVYLQGSHNRIERCVVSNSGSYGIYTGSGSMIINNIVYGNAATYAVFGGRGSNIIGNTVHDNTSTYAIYASEGSNIADNTVYNNTSTYGIYAKDGSNVINNTSYNNNGAYAIFGGWSTSLTGNTVYANTSTTALYGGNGAIIAGNAVSGNVSTYAIYASSAAKLTGNTAYSNTGWGIFGTGSNLIEGNLLYINNINNTADVGGLRIGSDSRVKGNTLDSNRLNNIYVSGSDNIIRENHFTDSINGIFFRISGNFYKDNTASGNTLSFNLNGTTQTSGSGNVSF